MHWTQEQPGVKDQALAGAILHVFLGKTLFCHISSLYPGVQIGSSEFSVSGSSSSWSKTLFVCLLF